MKIWKNLKRLVVISRPAGWLPFTCPYIAGVLVSGGGWSLVTWIGAFFCTLPMGIVVFGLNDMADKKSDVINSRKGGVAGAIVNDKDTRLLVWSATVVALFFEAAYLLTGHYWLALWTAGILAFAYTYSVPPIRLKSRPGLDGISNGLWGLFILLTGYVASSGLSQPISMRIVALAFLTGMVFHVLFTVADYEVDKKMNDRTIAVAIGKVPTLVICELIFLADIYITRYSRLGLKAFFILCALLTLVLIYRPTPKLVYRVTGSLVLLMPLLFGYLLFARYFS